MTRASMAKPSARVGSNASATESVDRSGSRWWMSETNPVMASRSPAAFATMAAPIARRGTPGVQRLEQIAGHNAERDLIRGISTPSARDRVATAIRPESVRDGGRHEDAYDRRVGHRVEEGRPGAPRQSDGHRPRPGPEWSVRPEQGPVRPEEGGPTVETLPGMTWATAMGVMADLLPGSGVAVPRHLRSSRW